jgi:very-short-patch-repair endonuclease
MDKKEYIMNQMKKTFGKKYENYCINRIISLVNRLDLKFVTQQLFKRKGKNIALADLYFPQINLWVEIDEEQHLTNRELDDARTRDVIENNTMTEEVKKKYEALEEVVYAGLEEPMRIIVYKETTIEVINEQIDEIVKEIKNRIEKLGTRFVPWEFVNFEPEYYLNKGSIDVSDNAKFKTIDKIAQLFNMVVPFHDKMHGYFCIKENIYCWCPILKLTGDECDKNAWENEISSDGNTIYEVSKKRNSEYLEEVLNQDQIRYIFTKYKDETGEKIYKFKGVFILDKEETRKLNKRVWIKIENEIKL